MSNDSTTGGAAQQPQQSQQQHSAPRGGGGRGRGRGAVGRARGSGGRGRGGRGGRGGRYHGSKKKPDDSSSTPSSQNHNAVSAAATDTHSNDERYHRDESAASTNRNDEKNEQSGTMENKKSDGGRGRGRGRGHIPRGGRGGRNSARGGRGRGKGRGRGGRGRGRGRFPAGREENDENDDEVHNTDGVVEDYEENEDNVGATEEDNHEADQEGWGTRDTAIYEGLSGSTGQVETVKEPAIKQLESSPNEDTTPTSASHSRNLVEEKLPVQEQHEPVLALPTPLPRSGKLMILSRNMKQPPTVADEKQAPEGTATFQDDIKQGKEAKPKKKKNKSKKKKEKEQQEKEEENPTPAAPEENVTTTEAIKKLPAQEVSITASTAVKIRRTESTASFISDNTPPNKIAPMMLLSKSGAVNVKGKKKKKKKLSSDDQANQEAAQRFNSAVQRCVAQSDPDGVRDLLHDRRNHNFALDAMVLETVMKAYIMAAMFEDSLYCLRHCTLPGTLAAVQTERILQCLPQNLRNSSAFTAADMINALCIATEFDTPMTRTYFLRIVRGIALEFLEEATSARDRICSSSCERLVRGGLCVVDARIERGKKASDLVVVPGHQLGVFVPDSMENRGIQAGDAVSVLPYAGPYPLSAESLDRNMIEATVTNTNPMVLRLQDKGNATLHAMLTEDVQGNVYRIDKLANRMGFNRQLSAAVAVCSPLNADGVLDPRRPSPQLIKAITAMDENIDRFMGNDITGATGPMQYRADGTLELTSTAALCNEGISWTYKDDKQVDYDDDENQDSIRMTARLMLEKYNALEGLNESQQLAVEGAVTNRLTLVQGPPGTG